MQELDEPGDEICVFTGDRGEAQSESTAPAIAGSKRKRYVSQACTECKKRKVRCSGEHPCSQCINDDVRCRYTGEPRKRGNPSARNDGFREQQSFAEEVLNHKEKEREKEDGEEKEKEYSWRVAIMTHLQSISKDLKLLKESRANFNPEDITRSQSSNIDTLMTPSSGDGSEACVNAPRPVFNGGPSILKPLRTLDERVGEIYPEASSSTSSNQQNPCWLAFCSDMTKCYLKELEMWDARIRHGGMKPLRESINTYFALLNPHYPCLDESLFDTDFERFVCNNRMTEVTLDRIQFIALVYLILATVKILEDFCAEDNLVPGWHEFIRAQHLLSHIIKSGNGNLITTQCLVLKSSYLLYVERHDWAYDEIGTAVRLCFQLGLHNQKLWTGISQHDIRMKQRTFWCIYCLERNISHQCGAPYQIKDKDVCVDLPSIVHLGVHDSDEKRDGFSPIPYLLATVKWAKLCSDMWDSMFGVNTHAITPEFVAMTDARILLLLSELPEYLRWSADIFRSVDYLQYPHYILRQSIVLHLRSNHLRLLLRRGDLLDASNGGRTAPICVEIASSSIEAMHEYACSPLRRNTERYPTVTYLSGSIVALTSIILSNKANADVLRKAIISFQKAVLVLENIAPGFSLGRRMLGRLQKIINATRQVIADTSMAIAPDASRKGPIASAFEGVPGSNSAIFDLDLDDLLHFESRKSLEDYSALFLQNSMNSSFAAYISPPLSGGVNILS